MNDLWIAGALCVGFFMGIAVGFVLAKDYGDST